MLYRNLASRDVILYKRALGLHFIPVVLVISIIRVEIPAKIQVIPVS